MKPKLKWKREAIRGSNTLYGYVTELVPKTVCCGNYLSSVNIHVAPVDEGDDAGWVVRIGDGDLFWRRTLNQAKVQAEMFGTMIAVRRDEKESL